MKHIQRILSMRVVRILNVVALLGVGFLVTSASARAGIAITHAQLNRYGQIVVADSAYPDSTSVVEDLQTIDLLTDTIPSSLFGNSYVTPGTVLNVSASFGGPASFEVLGPLDYLQSFGARLSSTGYLWFSGDESFVGSLGVSASLDLRFSIDGPTWIRMNLGWGETLTNGSGGIPPGFSAPGSSIRLFNLVDPSTDLVRGYSFHTYDGPTIVGPTIGSLDLLLSPGEYSLFVAVGGNSEITPAAYPSGAGFYEGEIAFASRRSFDISVVSPEVVPEPSSIVSLGIASLTGLALRRWPWRRNPR